MVLEQGFLRISRENPGKVNASGDIPRYSCDHNLKFYPDLRNILSNYKNPGYLKIFLRPKFKHLISGIFHGNIKILGYLEIFLQTTVHYSAATCNGSTMILTLVLGYSVTFKTSHQVSFLD